VKTQCFLLASLLALQLHAAPRYPDRLVWVFGWNLNSDNEVAEITRLFETAGQHQINGAVVSFGLDSLCKHPPDYFRRLEQVRLASEKNGVELIPSVFSVGYGGGTLSHDRNLAEGVLVENAPFLVTGNEARLVPDPDPIAANGGFEEWNGNSLKAFGFHDYPGEVSFADREVRHGGQASVRLQNFTANPHGHGRVMQSVKVRPHRSYRFSVWVKTEGLQPANAFRLVVLAGERDLAPRQFSIPSTGDWRKISLVFNSCTFEKVAIYAGLWGGKHGKLWLDDWTVEEVGPVNVLHRPGTPATVRSEDGSVTFTEGKDYAPLRDPNLQPFHDDKDALPLKIPEGSRIRSGDRLRVSWYHSMLIHDSQVTICMAEPAVYEIWDHEAKLLAEKLHPKRVLLNMDEVRMGGTCKACQGKDMAALLGECVTRQAKILRRHIPGAEVYVWSDMFDPNHNAKNNYYLVQGDFTGSWKHLPKDLMIAVWGGEPRPESLKFFESEGFRTLVACYYDADNLNEVKGWLSTARQMPSVRGFMYTPWLKKYDLLPAFGDLLWAEPGQGSASGK
jgi:hypothetical protein